MSKFTIYDRNGNVLHESITQYDGNGRVVYTDSLEYNGSWMGECFITISVKSPYPIDFQIGDYIDYRGERFTLNNDTAVSKKARRGTYGEAFVYENIKFGARQSELSEIRFLDYVLYDNELHYTSLPVFPFYAADIDDYVDRQQANTNKWCESNGFAVADYWLFVTPSKARTVQRAATFGMGSATASAIWEDAFAEGTYLDDEKKDISVDISKESIWDSMQRIKQDFGLNFISRGRRVIIGAAGVPTSRIFKYGKGEGLYEIERQADTDQAVVTKLFAYGSDKNMPPRYYGNIRYSYFSTVERIIANYETSGLHYANFIIDVDFSTLLFTNRSESYPGTSEYPNYIVEVKANDITVRGYVTKDYNSDRCKVYCEHTNSDDDRDEPDEAKMNAFSEAISSGDKVYFVGGIETKRWPADKRENTISELPNNMAVSHLMLPGFPTMSLYNWVVSHGGTAVSDARNCDSYARATWEYEDVVYDAFFSKEQYNPYILSLNFKAIGIREASNVFDGSDDTEEIYPTIEGTGYDVIADAEVIQDNGVFEDGDNEPTITLTLPSFGLDFDLKELAANGQNPTIYMRDGYCGSREFSFESGNVKKNQDGTYTVKAKREHDTLIDLWFPYSYGVSCGGSAVADEPYQVRAGDHYVLTGIEMTSTYIDASAVKLLGYSLMFLAKNDYTRYTYLPKVDEIEMARQHERAVASQGNERSLYLTLKEGDVMLFKDLDLGIDGDVFIDSLRIKENGNNGIPTFEVTLRNDKQVGTLQRIQNKVDSLSSSVLGGGNISGQYLQNAIRAYGSEMFLSKTKDDTAQGRIGFLKGLWVKALGLFGIDADGNARFNKVDADGDASVGGSLSVSNAINAVAGFFRTLTSSNYTGDGITDTGWKITEDYNGHSKLTIDELYVRMKAVFESLEIKRELVTGGNHVLSCAASTISFVDYLVYDTTTQQYVVVGYERRKTPFKWKNIALMLSKRNFGGIFSASETIRVPLNRSQQNNVSRVRCYFLAEEGGRKIENWWRVNDYARCQTFNFTNDSVSERDKYWGGAVKEGNVFWWEKVVNVSSSPVSIDGKMYHYFDIDVYETLQSNPDADIPAPGDEVSQWGNSSDPDRMNLIVTEVNGQDAAIKMYEGVNRFSMETGLYGNPLKIQLAPKTGCKISTSKWELMSDNFVAPSTIERGEWTSGTTAHYYEVWQYDGSSWLCVAANGTYRVTEAFGNYSVGQVISQSVYDGLTLVNKLKCSRTSLGTTLAKPSSDSADWRIYAKAADVWTIGQGSLWYKNGVLYTDQDHPNGIKAEGEDGTGVQLKGSVNVLYHSATETSLEDLTGMQVGDCYVVDANRHIYFYNGSSSAFPANWNDLGEFRGQKGDNSYMHIAYADDVTFDAQGVPTSCTGFTTIKLKEAYDWIGLCTDNSSIDPATYTSYAWNYVKGDDGKDAPDLKTNILLRTYFEKGLEFIKEKWDATHWGWVSMDSSQDAQYIEGHQSIRLVIPAGVGNETMLYQSVLGKLKPDTWYTISWYDFASKGYIFCIHNIINNVYTNLYADGKVIVDGVEYSVTNDHNDVPITGAWEGNRHYITFKTKSVVEGGNPISTTYLILGWYFYNDSGSAAQNFVLCMPKLEEGQTATAYMANEDDLRGEDAWSIAANPANVIITQGMGTDVSQFSSADVTFSARKGNTIVNVISLSNVVWERFAGVVDYNNMKVTVRNPLSSGGVYYTEGWFSVDVGVRDPNTNSILVFNVKVPCYANLLGSWKTKVVGDTEVSVAEKLTHGYDPTHQGDPIALQNFGTYIRSSEVNISEIKATRSKEDLFNFGLNNWTVNDAEFKLPNFHFGICAITF